MTDRVSVVEEVIEVSVTGETTVDVVTVREESVEVVEVGIQGPAGPKGDTGAAGPKGDPGESGSGDLTYSQAFNVTDTVVVTHNLGKYPSVHVFDSAGDEVLGSVRYDSLNQLSVSFSAPFSGTVIAN